MTSAPAMPVLPVRRRLVLHVPGYEPLPPEAQRRRLARAIARTAACWGLRASIGEAAGPEGTAILHARLQGPDWQTEAEIRILAWDDLIARDLAMPLPARIGRGLAVLGRLLADGTLGRYGRAQRRYLAFVALPVALLGAALLAGLAAGLALGGWAGLVLGAGVSALVILAADRRLHLGHLLADWIFAADLARGRRRDAAARIARFAAEIQAARRRRDVEEVVLCGHSLGMVLLVEALAEALAAEPEPPRPAPRLALVGLGSSVPKIALMPGAERLRAALARLAATPRLAWVEYTSRRDLLSFHRADVMRMLGIAGGGPRRESIHPRSMLDDAQWRRARFSMLRAHRAYLAGNARRYFYDWGMIACGPGAAGRDAPPDRLLGPDGALARPRGAAA
jgi:hypothetical protein